MARGLFVGLWLLVLVHVCIAVKPADKPAAKPRRARTSFSAVANDDGTGFFVTAALGESRVTWPFSIEDWTSGESDIKKRVKARKRKMIKKLEGPEMASEAAAEGDARGDCCTTPRGYAA